MMSYGIDVGRRRKVEQGHTNKESDVELELRDNGGIRLYTSRLSDAINSDAQAVFEAMAVGFTHELIALVEAASVECGYFGSWSLAFGATHLRGSVSFKMSEGWRGGTETAPYSEDVYKAAALTSYAELSARPGDVADRLVSGLLRGYSTRHIFLPALSTPVTTSDEPDE